MSLQDDGVEQEGLKVNEDLTDEQLENLGKLQQEKETSEDSSPTKKTEEEQPAQEGDNTPEDKLPFHKHPRWKELMHERELDKEKIETLEEQLSQIDGNVEKLAAPTDVPSRPAWFTKLYGEDDEAWKLYYGNEQELETQRIQRATELIKQENQRNDLAKTQAEKEALRYIEDSIQSLKDEGKIFDEAELQKIVAEYQPTDDEGNLDFRKGYNLLVQLKKNPATQEKDTARKQVASQTITKSKSSTTEKPFGTTQNLRHRSWTSLAQED